VKRAALLLLLTTATSSAVELSPRLRLVARGPVAIDGKVRVTIRTPGGADALRSLGLPARALTPSVASVEVDRATLQWLAAQRDLDAHVEEERLLHPTLDVAGALVGATQARASTGLTGRGVLVGVADTGVDFHHADLRNLDGTSRVQLLLDLSQPPDQRHPELGTFGGPIWDRGEIDAQIAADGGGPTPVAPVSEKDTAGHGTHVASIATSNGYATARGLPAGRYVGIAPEAGLVVVQAADANGNFTDGNILDACNFMVTAQQALGLPMVVNLSLGGPGGPHDGSTNLEVGLDELFPPDLPGHALVVAAGNDGGNDLHAGGWALDGSLEVRFHVPSSAQGFAMEIWYRGTLDVSVADPSFERSESIKAGDIFDKTGQKTRLRIDNASMGANPSGLRNAAIVLSDATGKKGPETGDYTIFLHGKSIRWDAWVLGSFATFTDSVDETNHADTPATARSAISVGALVSRLSWPTLDDGLFMPPGADPAFIGGPAFFSSEGPTTDGRFAPDLAAPGEFVVAALSRDAPPTSPSSDFYTSDPTVPADVLIADDGLHGVLRGTSQATPMVAGAIALLFEAAPGLTSTTLRELLRTTASPIPGTAGFSPRVGFGGLDVSAALALLSGTFGSAADGNASTVGLSRDLLPPESEETTVVTVTPRDASGVVLGPGHSVAIELAGVGIGELALGDVRDLGAGRYERSFVAHAPRGTSAEVSATVDGVALADRPIVWFVRSRAEIGGDLVAGNGCGVGGRSRASGNAVAVIAVLLLGLRRRAFRVLAMARSAIRAASS